MRKLLISVGAGVAAFLVLGNSWHKTALIPGRPGPGARDGWECGTFLSRESVPSFYSNSPRRECDRMLDTLQFQSFAIALVVGIAVLVWLRKNQSDPRRDAPAARY